MTLTTALTTVDTGIFEARAQFIASHSQIIDLVRYHVGLVVTRTERRYGAGTVEALSRRSGKGRSTLYEWGAYYRFMRGWLGLSARRKIAETPVSYTMVRTAMRAAAHWAIAVEWLEQAAGMCDVIDPVIKDRGWAQPLTEDQFITYVRLKAGKSISPKPFFEASGQADQVQQLLRQQLRHTPDRRVRVKAWIEE